SDFEILVINDGSQDVTLDILANINDSRLKVFSYPNKGLAASRNRGISHASGDFIAFLDADDLWTADKLEAQLKALQANPQVAVAYSWTDFIDEFGQPLGSGIHKTFNGDVFANLLVDNFIVNGSNTLIRKKAIIEVGGFYESLCYVEDWDLWLRLAACFQFVAVPSAQILYRRTNDSMSMNVLGLEQAYLKIMQRAFNQAPDSLKYLKRQSFARFYQFLTLRALEVLPGREIIFPSPQKGRAAAR
ncbi:glycosyl transferase, group 2 family protein, partial [Candidatus Thiomargarita nelsonii]